MTLPGNANHRKILKIFLEELTKDTNIRVVGIFGSVARGNWDKYSDLDLDVVVKDDSKQMVGSEIKSVLSSLTQHGLEVLLYFEELTNEYVLIFDTLDRVSIRFHLIEDTVLHILDSFKVLYGDLSPKDIRLAIVKKDKQLNTIEILKDKFIELSIYVPIALHRNQLINAEFFVAKMRNTLIEIYTKLREIPRFFDFEKMAEQDIKEKILSTYPTLDTDSIKKARKVLISLFNDSILRIGNNKISLSGNEKSILRKTLKYY